MSGGVSHTVGDFLIQTVFSLQRIHLLRVDSPAALASLTGHFGMVKNQLVTWSLKVAMDLVKLSSTEARYVKLSNGGPATIFVRNFLK